VDRRHVLDEGDDGLGRVLDGEQGLERGEDLEAKVVGRHAARDVEDVGQEERDEVGLARLLEERGEDLAPHDLVREAREDLQEGGARQLSALGGTEEGGRQRERDAQRRGP